MGRGSRNWRHASKENGPLGSGKNGLGEPCAEFSLDIHLCFPKIHQLRASGVKAPQALHRLHKSHPGFWKTGVFPKINLGKLASPPGEEEPGWQGANGINPGKMGY